LSFSGYVIVHIIAHLWTKAVSCLMRQGCDESLGEWSMYPNLNVSTLPEVWKTFGAG